MSTRPKSSGGPCPVGCGLEPPVGDNGVQKKSIGAGSGGGGSNGILNEIHDFESIESNPLWTGGSEETQNLRTANKEVMILPAEGPRDISGSIRKRAGPP